MHCLMTLQTSMRLHCFEMMKLPHSTHLFQVCDGVASYKVFLKATVAREYEEIDSKADRRRILGKIVALTANPRPAEAIKLPESDDLYRVCLAHHRVIYQIVDDPQKQVTIFRIADRRRQSSTW
jgi:mRNA-degrading endonuclease RelE of RelBE toxin-antitoxin system